MRISGAVNLPHCQKGSKDAEQDGAVGGSQVHPSRGRVLLSGKLREGSVCALISEVQKASCSLLQLPPPPVILVEIFLLPGTQVIILVLNVRH